MDASSRTKHQMKARDTFHLCLDGRRTDKGGIGRVTQEIELALSGQERIDLTVLCPPAEMSVLPVGVRKIPCNFGPLSLAEYEQLPGIIVETGCDIFISPQFYAPPNITVPVVSWVHDVWPLLHSEWLPPLSSVFNKFGEDSRSAGALIVSEYEQRRLMGDLFPGNKFLAATDASPKDPLHRFVVAMFALNLDRSVKLIACSNHSREEITRLFPEVRTKIRTIYNPVPKFALSRRSEVHCSSEPVLLHVSKWETRKNIPRLIRAVRLLSDSHSGLILRLAGRPVSDSSREAVHEAIHASGVAEQVQIFDNVSDNILATLYSTATGFVMPSLYEGFSLPVVEAFGFGIPVAASNRAALPEIAADAALYFDPYDEQDMARAIETVLFNQPVRRLLAERSARRLEELLSMPFRESILATFIATLHEEVT